MLMLHVNVWGALMILAVVWHVQVLHADGCVVPVLLDSVKDVLVLHVDARIVLGSCDIV